jgi:predicted secreted acid phosphatase
MIQVGTLLKIENEMFIVYNIRKDGKIYFHDLKTNQNEYTTTIEQIKEQKWEVL